MHADLPLVLTITAGLAFALVLGYVTHRLGLSSIVGYLLAGVCVGPYTPGYVADAGLAHQLSEIGVVLLMFGVGLHFHLKELLAVRNVAIPGAVGQSVVATVLGAAAAHAFGWDWTAGIVFGLALSVASTVVLMRVLEEHRALHTRSGHIAVGWLVVEDLFTVVVLVLLQAMFGGQAQQAGDAGGGGALAALGVALLKIALFVAFAFVVGGRLVPALLSRMAVTRSRELFTLTVLVVALGVAVGATELFGVSMALGAFLAGMIVGRTEFSHRAAAEALPMRDAFAVLFFVSVGMLFDPGAIAERPGLFAATLAIVLLGKPLAALAIVLVLRYPLRTAVSVGVALAQIGEFSFILGTLGEHLGVLPRAANNVLVAVAIVTITLNPLLFRWSRLVEPWIARHPRVYALLGGDRAAAPEEPLPATKARSDAHRAVVVGYGPVGQTVTRLLRENDVEPTVVDLNIDTVRKLLEQGGRAVYGDATRPDTLLAAGADHAGTLVLTASAMGARVETIRTARELNARMRILVRADYVREAAELRAAGADAVFTGEAEVALAVTEAVLEELGATPDQIDRERDRVREALTPPAP